MHQIRILGRSIRSNHLESSNIHPFKFRYVQITIRFSKIAKMQHQLSKSEPPRPALAVLVFNISVTTKLHLVHSSADLYQMANIMELSLQIQLSDGTIMVSINDL